MVLILQEKPWNLVKVRIGYRYALWHNFFHKKHPFSTIFYIIYDTKMPQLFYFTGPFYGNFFSQCKVSEVIKFIKTRKTTQNSGPAITEPDIACDTDNGLTRNVSSEIRKILHLFWLPGHYFYWARDGTNGKIFVLKLNCMLGSRT